MWCLLNRIVAVWLTSSVLTFCVQFPQLEMVSDPTSRDGLLGQVDELMLVEETGVW